MTPAPGIQLGIVVASYPQGRSVDVLIPDNGDRLTNVQVMLYDGASDQSGTADLPDPGLPQDDTRWDINQTAPTVIQAVIVSYKGIPFCIGFLPTQVTQMTFADKNLRIQRHISDVYTTIDALGNAEFFHPSGTYARVGAAGAHVDLTGLDVDQLFAITKNKTAPVYFHAEVQNNGVTKALIDVDPDGNCTLTLQGNLTATVNGTGGATLTTPNGQINLNGVTIDSSGNMDVPGTFTAASTTTGDGIVLETHTHSGVTTGTGDTGPPV